MADEIIDVLDNLGGMPGITISDRQERKQDIREALAEIFPDGNILGKTILNDEQILIVSYALAYCDAHPRETTFLKQLTLNLLIGKISYGGWGRKDMRIVLQTLLNQEKAEPEESGLAKLRRRLLG